MSTRPAVETEAPNRRILTPLVRAISRRVAQPTTAPKSSANARHAQAAHTRRARVAFPAESPWRCRATLDGWKWCGRLLDGSVAVGLFPP